MAARSTRSNTFHNAHASNYALIYWRIIKHRLLRGMWVHAPLRRGRGVPTSSWTLKEGEATVDQGMGRVLYKECSW